MVSQIAIHGIGWLFGTVGLFSTFAGTGSGVLPLILLLIASVALLVGLTSTPK